jgi:hypothetical protein
MSDEIRTGDIAPGPSESTRVRRLVPMQVGNATVFVEDIGEPALIDADDQVRPVAPPSPQEAFENAGKILHECVRVLGQRIESLAANARPKEITVEFSLSFEVKGRASIIPVFLTGESSAQTGLKVTAVWGRKAEKGFPNGDDSTQS